MSSCSHCGIPTLLDQRVVGSPSTAQLARNGMTIREIDLRALQQAAERLWGSEARAHGITSWLEAIRA